jgi:hypothetical protein
MGGKNPLIVLKDADIDYAVRAAAFGIFFHQGQVCMANSKILVEKPVFEEFCAKFTAVAKSLKVGDPKDPQTIIGPLIRKAQCAVIDGHVEDARAKGAQVLCGASHHDQFYLPTVLAGVQTAAVIGVGTATVAAFVGAGGLGERIVAGLAVNDAQAMLAGALPAALLALAVQGAFGLVERLLLRSRGG